MIVSRIKNPLPGERVVSVDPTMSPTPDLDWRRRMNLYTGRSLSEVALTTEQDSRAGRLVTRGQMVSPGVVDGLEVSVEEIITRVNNQRTEEIFFHISPGLGLTVKGEDVVFPFTSRIALKDIRVYLPSEGVLSDRLGELRARNVKLPLAMVLVLQPVVIEKVGEFDPDDPCEEDPKNFAFEDRVLVDGCRLVLYAWPTEEIRIPGFNRWWRNRLAYAIFGAEKDRGPLNPLPWEEIGVPIGLVGFDSRLNFSFLDRHSVVRAGGKPRRRSLLVPKSGNPYLWQARVQQLAEHMAEHDFSKNKIKELASHFRYLPPVGLLPKDAIAIDVKANTRKNFFFPSSYTIHAVPVPVEQLDVAMDASASLLPYDTFTPDHVRVLVPVPQVWYEPHLLEPEVVDPAFQNTLNSFLDRRAVLLHRRDDVREKADVIIKAITGKSPEFPDPDPEALEQENKGSGPLNPPELDYGTKLFGQTRRAELFENLITILKSLSIKGETAAHLASSPISTEMTALKNINPTLNYDGARQALTISGKLSVAQRDAMLAAALPLNTDLKNAIRELHRRSQNDTLVQLEERGVQGFIEFMQGNVDHANDRMDAGFARLQTDIYRFRQLMLGNVAGTRLATSQTIAAIAQGESALATRKDLNDFIIKNKLTEAGPVTPSGAIKSNFVADDDGDDVPSKSFATQVTPGGGFAQPQPANLSISGEAFIGLTGGGFTGNVVKITETKVTTTAQKIQEQATVGVTGLFASQDLTKDAIIEKAPIIGKGYDFRTLTVAERIKEPPAPEAKTFSVASKYEVLKMIVELSDVLDLDDLLLPGFYVYNGNAVSMKTVDVFNRTGVKVGVRSFPEERRVSVLELKGRNLATDVLAERHDLDPEDADEGGFFAAGVRAMDHTAAMLRIVEGRIQSFKHAIVAAKQTLIQLREFSAQIDERLKVIADDLAEARHDVAVARALLAEEQVRVQTINDRREWIIKTHVQFLAYHRPRTRDLLANTPARALNPGLTEEPVPACLERHEAVPPELRAMVELLRESPVKWFTRIPKLLDKIDRLENLQKTILSAKTRAQIQMPIIQAGTQLASIGKLGQSVEKVFAAQQQVLGGRRVQVAQLDLNVMVGQSWKVVREQAKEIVSVGDLIDASHGRSDVAQQATKELDDIAHVAACLYTDFGHVPPAVRLTWAERLSQHDTAVNLRNLSSLPRWGGKDKDGDDLIEFTDRRAMQMLVDWLYQRVNAGEPEAVAMISDLIRMCILLASHAPVNQIIAGHVAKPVTLVKDGRVELDVDFTKVRVGMQVLMYSAANEVVGRGVVEDLSGDKAAARMVQVFKENHQLNTNSRVQFAEATTLNLTALPGKKF